MNACQLLLQNKPEWAEDKVIMIGHLLESGKRDYDQVFIHDYQLVDAYGNPVAATEKIFVSIVESVPTLREIADPKKPAPCTPEAIGFHAGRKEQSATDKRRLETLLGWYGE
jgi:hypothetical protein